MNPQGDYPYYQNNQMKDMNSGQGTMNKHNKKGPYKNFKNDLGKNNQNNMDEKFNMQNSEHNQNFQHMRGGINKKGYRTYQKNQSEDFNSGFNPNYKKKKNKKRDNNNNDFQYANNSTNNISNNQIDISQSKDEYYDQQNQSQNNHQIYNKQYKKNQNAVFNSSNNTNNSNNSNSASTNLTPNRQNPMATPYGFNSNLANSPANLNFNFNNANQHGNNANISGGIMSPQTGQKNPNIYMNPNLVYMSGMPNSINISENEQDSSIKDEKSSENLSEEAALSQASLQGRNAQNQQQSDLQKINPQNEYVNPILINNKFMRQPNYIGMPYNMSNIPNMGNINNLNNINDLNNFAGMNNLNNNMNMNANNLGNLGNLNMNNFSMQQLYEHQNNPLVNAAALAGIPPVNYSQMTEELAMNQKKLKKNINKSPMEQTHSLNASINLGMLPNLNYNGPNNKFIKTNNGLQGLNKNSISLQGNKNTIPNFNQSDNLNFVFSQNKMQPDISSLMNPIANRTFYVQQNTKNFHNNANNMSGSSHLMNVNTNPLAAAASSKNNMFLNKEFINSNMYNNSNNPNNKKFQKQMNYNNNNNQQNSNLNNNNSSNNKNNQYNENNNNSNIFKSANSNKINNNNIKDLPKNNSNQNMGETQMKQYTLKIRLKLDNEEFDTIELKSKEDSRLALKDIKLKKNIDEKIIMLLQNKIKEAFDVTKNILGLKLDKYTIKSLIEINRIINTRAEKELENFGLSSEGNIIKRNKSFDGKNDDKDFMDYKERESLNLSC